LTLIHRVPERDVVRRAHELSIRVYDTSAAPWKYGARTRALDTVVAGKSQPILDVGMGHGAFVETIARRAPAARVEGR